MYVCMCVCMCVCVYVCMCVCVYVCMCVCVVMRELWKEMSIQGCLFREKPITLYVRRAPLAADVVPSSPPSHVEPDELVYLPPEAMRTLYMERQRLHRAKTSRQTFAANIFSFG